MERLGYMVLVEKNGNESFELDVKRCYLPFTLTTDCTHCGERLIDNLQHNYLSSPMINKTFSYIFYCLECDNESSVELEISMDIKVKSDIRKEC
jgi:hypothetical protein